MSNRPACHHQRGYTLAELLVVLALLGFIALMISGGISFGTRLWEATSRKVSDVDQVTSAQTVLRTLLQRVIPRDLDPGIPADPSLFRASAEKMSFTASSPAAIDASGIARFNLAVEKRSDGTSLNLTWIATAGEKRQQKKRLVSGAAAITFSYATLDQTGTMIWRADWQDQSGVPALIVVRVEFPPSSAQRWPELIIRPRISREPTCIYDPVSMACRHA